jgi:hypothetical protein
MVNVNDTDKIIGTLELSPEQSEMVSKAAGRKIRVCHLVELSAAEVKHLAPGLLYGRVVRCCW